MSAADEAIRYARSNKDRFLEDLKALIRIPSISTLSERKEDIRRAAEWIAGELRSYGFHDVEIAPTAKHPVVLGEYTAAGPSAPTLLFYGHYDVQPVDPVDLWKSDPFEPTIRGDNLFARGASDMKGQLVAHMKAIESLVRTEGMKVNIRCLLEGEEEIGSPSLEAFVVQNTARLKADLCLNGDSGILGPEEPSINYALRGLIYFELRLTGPASDLHSGSYGGAVANPATILCQLIAKMRDLEGRVHIPGFYDHVRKLSPSERKEFAALPMPDEWWREQTGAPALPSVGDTTALERAWCLPTFDVNGLLSGFTGEGSKTVLPSKAMAKFSMRLVPDQTVDQVRKGVQAFLQANVPPTVAWELIEHASSRPAIVERDSTAVQAASRALEAVWGRPPAFVRSGGSVAVVGMIQEIVGVDTLMLGYGLQDDNLHAPNEKQYLPNFFRGIEATIHFFDQYAALSRGA
jgi:acetylornithine deacetylase/succinyl-diaminopimelate desuccinylase-like protein